MMNLHMPIQEKMRPSEKEFLEALEQRKLGDSIRLVNVNLSEFHLRGVNLRDANLQNVDLSETFLSDVNLSYSQLHNCYLDGANLKNASLLGVGFYGVSLVGADLRSADLRLATIKFARLGGADLSSANLKGSTIFSSADFARANIRRADLREVVYHNFSVANFLSCDWGKCSDELTKELMLFDMECCPDGRGRFKKWAFGRDENCPFERTVSRMAYFKQDTLLWSEELAGRRAKPAVELVRMLFEEHDVKSDIFGSQG